MAKVAFLQCASCWGCHQSLLNAHLTLLNVLPELEVVYWPAVVDFKWDSFVAREDKSVDVGFIEGFIRTEHDLEAVKTMREKCNILVAIGSCAVYGGVPGLANLYPIEELLQRKFQDDVYMDPGSEVPNVNLPKILDTLNDNHAHVKIDVDLPGCPPVSGNIIGLISSLLGSVDANIDTEKSMCDVCPLETCLLKEDKLCFGPITAVGENYDMLKMGYPILGEFGLTKAVHAEYAMKLLNKLTANPLNKKEIQLTVEALLLLLKGPVALGYLDGRKDMIRQTKLAPDNVQMKKIADPVDVEKQVEVASVALEDYPDVVNDVLGACLAELKNNPEYDESAKTICSSCPNNVQDKTVEKYKRDFEGFSDPYKCLLVQGYVCMGPITRAGCGTLCPKANTPCSGCYGPALNVSDYGAKALSYFPSICTDTPENIAAFFKDPVGVFNRFTTASSKLGNNVHENGGKENNED